MTRATRDLREKRRSWGSRTLLALVAHLAPLAGLVAFESDAHAFCRSTTCRGTEAEPCNIDDSGCPADGAKLFWPTSCVSYATNELGTSRLDPDETRAVIRKAFQAWSDVGCPDGTVASMTFQERAPVPCHKSQYNPKGPNVNVILFQDTMWKYRGVDATLAKTSVTYSDDTGEIFDADIEINSAFNDMTITDDPDEIDTDLQAVITHEAGHFIGLAHSPDLEAVMYAQYPPHSTSQRYLAADDIAAVCATYPENKGFRCNTEPRGGFSATCDDPPAEKAQCSVASGTPSLSGGLLAVLGCGLGVLLRGRRTSRARGAVSRGERR